MKSYVGRMLIVFALVLNSMTGAVAGVTEWPAPMPMDVHKVSSQAHCHDAMADVAAPSDPAPAECCKSGSCDCLHAAQLAEIAVLSPAVVPAIVPLVHTSGSYHSPTSPQPLRPPIG